MRILRNRIPKTVSLVKAWPETRLAPPWRPWPPCASGWPAPARTPPPGQQRRTPAPPPLPFLRVHTKQLAKFKIGLRNWVQEFGIRNFLRLGFVCSCLDPGSGYGSVLGKQHWAKFICSENRIAEPGSLGVQEFRIRNFLKTWIRICSYLDPDPILLKQCCGSQIRMNLHWFDSPGSGYGSVLGTEIRIRIQKQENSLKLTIKADFHPLQVCFCTYGRMFWDLLPTLYFHEKDKVFDIRRQSDQFQIRTRMDPP